MIIIDIETTGTNPDIHAIASIGAIDFNNINNTFYSEASIWPGAKILDEALAINGFSAAELQDPSKESQYILMKSFIDWFTKIDDFTPAGLHVGVFDISFLEKAAQREGLNWPLGKRSIDLHTTVYQNLIKRGVDHPLHNQHSAIDGAFIQEYCGIEPVLHPHNALNDARWEGECFSRLLYGRNWLPEFADQPLPSYLIQNV